jgi:putative intracellular protease/amidase
MLEETTTLVTTKFPAKDSVYVNERFFADWRPDHGYSWQQNRAVVGHNHKIAWNLTRVAFYFTNLAQASGAAAADAARWRALAAASQDLAAQLAQRMVTAGLDLVRGGVYDCVERVPSNGMPLEFTWENTKDFWQQEQAILAYLIRHGAEGGQGGALHLARDCGAFWNAFFLDRDRCGIFFRTTGDGVPIIEGSYAHKAGHAISGYHAFELGYLAHAYTRAFVDTGSPRDGNLALHFRIEQPDAAAINVFPDFAPAGTWRVEAVTANGVPAPVAPEAGASGQVLLPAAVAASASPATPVKVIVTLSSTKRAPAAANAAVAPGPAMTATPAVAAPGTATPAAAGGAPSYSKLAPREPASSGPLAGKRIAVVVESQFIPAEVATYLDQFAAWGASVELVSRLWGAPKQRFYSTVEPGVVDTVQWLDATVDVDAVAADLHAYAAVIVAANYASVRLRWNENAPTATDPAAAARAAPAARLLQAAMRQPGLVKGAPCHGLWLLTPSPDLLKGRRVACNPVVLADVVNAGATVVPAPADGSSWDKHIVTDGDLVTCTSAHNAAVVTPFAEAVRDAILRVRRS